MKTKWEREREGASEVKEIMSQETKKMKEGYGYQLMAMVSFVLSLDQHNWPNSAKTFHRSHWYLHFINKIDFDFFEESISLLLWLLGGLQAFQKFMWSSKLL